MAEAADGTTNTVAPPPLPWTKGLAPRYIALYLLVIYLDQLTGRTLAVGGVGPTLLGLTAGGVLAFLLLFYPSAIWGLRTRRPFEGVATATFGTTGARWLSRGVIGLVEVVWFAVALYYAIDLTGRALAAYGLLDFGQLMPVDLGGRAVSSPLFLWMALAWSIASALIGTIAFRLVAAVMAGYQPFVALGIGLVAAWSLSGAPGYQAPGLDLSTGTLAIDPAPQAFWMALQLVFGYTATFGLLAADWGAASRDSDDVRWGGFVGVALASVVLGTLAVLIVAGFNGREGSIPPEASAQLRLADALHQRRPEAAVAPLRAAVVEGGAFNYTLRGVISRSLSGLPAGTMLMILNLGLLGPACFAPFIIGQRLSPLRPGWPRWIWPVLGALATWPLIALRLPERLDIVFGLLGALTAPLAGALAADSLRHRGAWPGPRLGLNPPGLIASLAGLLVGLIPLLGPALGQPTWERFQPASLLAFAVGFVVYFTLALVGLEAPAMPEPEPIAEPLPTAAS